MPLLTICGLPLSGKTSRAKEIQQILQKHCQDIIIINDEMLGLDPFQVYKNATEEKKARGNLMSSVERYLSKETIVICDSLNYIKGYRYQLYCVARALGTPNCTLLCGIKEDAVMERNSKLKRYDPDIIENLCSRFEEPDGRNRWDSPLFISIPEDDISVVAQQIVQALVFKQAPAPNLSTRINPIKDVNYLAELDRITTEILEKAIEAQKDGRVGTLIVPFTTDKITLPSRFISLSEFRRLKRQFMTMNKLHNQTLENVASGFVSYLNTNLT